MTLEEVRKQAEDLAKKYNPDGKVPFPYQKMSQDYPDLFISESEKFFDDDRGGITFLEDKKTFVILIKKDMPFVKQNFLTAHEVGHYFLHPEIIKKKEILLDREVLINEDFEQLVLHSDSESEIEKEATNFAASLLMPTELVIQLWESLEDVKECAHVFGVPLVAMVIRLEKLGLLE